MKSKFKLSTAVTILTTALIIPLLILEALIFLGKAEAPSNLGNVFHIGIISSVLCVYVTWLLRDKQAK